MANVPTEHRNSPSSIPARQTGNYERVVSPEDVSRSTENALSGGSKPLSIDLRTLEYVSGFDRNLMCPICHCPFVHAVRLGCDHTFCKHCLNRALQNQSRENKTCPSCRRDTAAADVLPLPRFLSHMIDELLVKCPKSHLGCETQLKRGDVQDHVDFYCAFSEVDCPSPDCKLKIPRNLMSKGCLHGIVKCENCQMSLMERDLNVHLENNCTMKATSCGYCDETMVQSELADHLKKCDQVLVPCDAASIGCKFMSKRVESDDHKSTCALLAILPTLQSMSRQIDDQDSTIRDLQRQNGLLEGTIAQMQYMPGDSSKAVSNENADMVSTALPPPPVEGVAHSSLDPRDPPFDSATHHLLSLHESLREELDRLSSAVSELDARSSLTIMNESLRIREEMAHTNAAIRSMRMQLDWLTSARLQSQPRALPGPSTLPKADASGSIPPSTGDGPAQPIRRLSDSSRSDTKL